MKLGTQSTEFDGDVQLFSFGLETPFLGKFGPKKQNCFIMIKFGA